MSLSKVNNYGIGDNNFTSFQQTLDRTRRGLSEVTLSEYDTDAAPAVKVGSVFENNGAFFEVITADETPTGYAGISNSTTFYLYFDESAEAFIYSSAAPTWVDARQGWYNGNDRALFSMYKDSGGTLYEDKALIKSKSDNNINTVSGKKIQTKILDIGDWNMDTTPSIGVAHGLGSGWMNVRSVWAIVRDDADTTRLMLNKPQFSAGIFNGNVDGGVFDIDSSDISLARSEGGGFDSSLYDSTSFNRGWVYIVYEV